MHGCHRIECKRNHKPGLQENDEVSYLLPGFQGMLFKGRREEAPGHLVDLNHGMSFAQEKVTREANHQSNE